MTKYQGLEKREIIREFSEKLGSDRLIEVLEAVDAQQGRHAEEILESLSIPGRLPEDAGERLIGLLHETCCAWKAKYGEADLNSKETLATFFEVMQLSRPRIAQILEAKPATLRQQIRRADVKVTRVAEAQEAQRRASRWKRTEE